MVTAEQILAGRILIVDGLHTGMEFIEAALRTGGYSDITVSHNADEACKLHEKFDYDLIMLNLEVPDLDCFQVIEAARKLTNNKSLPTVVFSNDSSQRMRALEMGVRDYVIMPFEMPELLLRVYNTIETRLLYTKAKSYTIVLENALKKLEISHDLNQVLNIALQGEVDVGEDKNTALEAKLMVGDKENFDLESYSHSVSHDLRSPLRFVNRIAHMMLKNTEEPLALNATAQMNMIMQATDEMGELIERLLTFSQASREPMNLRKVDLKRLFQEASKELKYEDKGRSVEVVVEDIPFCMGDRTLLKEVVANLLENAFKFAQKREDARITVGFKEKEGENVYFVKDNGAGFDMKKSDSLFIPFQRLHKGEDFKGTGIGLALVKRIIERHGGRIWAEGIVGRGATFYFTLSKETKIVNVFKKIKIMLIDDDRQHLKDVRAHLEELGYEVATAENGRTGLKLSLGFIPNLVVLDLEFPDSIKSKLRALSGLDVLQMLRESGSVPIIILSGSTITSIKAMALSFGANDYMSKPFDIHELSEHIAALLDKEAA